MATSALLPTVWSGAAHGTIPQCSALRLKVRISFHLSLAFGSRKALTGMVPAGRSSRRLLCGDTRLWEKDASTILSRYKISPADVSVTVYTARSSVIGRIQNMTPSFIGFLSLNPHILHRSKLSSLLHLSEGASITRHQLARHRQCTHRPGLVPKMSAGVEESRSRFDSAVQVADQRVSLSEAVDSELSGRDVLSDLHIEGKLKGAMAGDRIGKSGDDEADQRLGT